MERREFIILTAAGAASALVLEGCGTSSEELKPLHIANDKYIPGADYWRATVCRECAAGCGLIVRVRDGKANKIEGNPLHPISRGKTCARGQAGLNALYNPDRIKHPLKRVGPPGSGQFEKIEWEAAIKLVADRMNELYARGRAASVAWLEGSAGRGQFSALVRRFMSVYGSTNLFWHRTFSRAVEYSTFGMLPTYDLARADFVLSFGARFLETWASPVYYSRGFGEMRRGRRLRGRFVQAEARMSLTAANADQWLPVRPGAEGVLALSIAHELIREKKLSPTRLPSPGPMDLAAYDPEKTQEATGIAPATVRHLAKELAESQTVAVLGGDSALAHTNGLFNLAAILYLNQIANGGSLPLLNLSRPGKGELAELRLPSPLTRSTFEKAKQPQRPTPLSELSTALREGLQVLMIHGANPLYDAPAAFKLREALEKIPLIVSFSSFEDETTSYADLVLPDHTPFERWDDDEPQEGVQEAIVSLAQPVVEPLYQTRHTGDVLLALAKQITPLKSEFKAESFLDLLKQAQLDKEQGEGAQQRWEEAVLRGGWWRSENEPDEIGKLINPEANFTIALEAEIPDSAGASQSASNVAKFAGDEKEFPYHFLPYEHFALGDGRTANYPLLQELPDPMTAVSWGSWVEINPQTAAKLGINQGDLVAVESPYGRIEAPAVLYPAIRPDVVAMPAGQGHERYGRYATGRGANPLKILAPLTEAQTGALAWAATRVRISKAEGQARLVTFGTNERLLEDRKDLKR
jgi:anaerobic selenocysteine-containing dehydrogenase